MPTYDYRCRKCGHVFELFHSIKDDKPKKCPRCKGKAERVPSSGAGLLFKGTGFYITDYRSRSYKEGKAKQDKSGGDGGSKAGDGGGKSKGGDKPPGPPPKSSSGGSSSSSSS